MATKFCLGNQTLSVRQNGFSPSPLSNDVAIGSGFVKELDFLNLGIGSFPLNVASACVFCACPPLRVPHTSIQWDFIEQCGELT